MSGLNIKIYLVSLTSIPTKGWKSKYMNVFYLIESFYTRGNHVHTS